MLHRFYRFSKRCRPFSQNGTECNDKNYGKKLPFYGRTTERNLKLFLSPIVYREERELKIELVSSLIENKKG